MHVWIYTGSAAWTRALSRAQTGLPVLALPHGRSPDSYCWPVSGFDVTVVGDDEPEDVLRHLAFILQQSGARLIAVVCGRSGQRVIYYGQCAGGNNNDK